MAGPELARSIAAILQAATAALALAPRAGATGAETFVLDREARESNGATLRASATGLLRTLRGVQTIIGCTSPEGAGAILDLAADHAGLTFVVAENGLFVLAPDVDVMDPVVLGEGAPVGHPTSVHVDQERRLWIATDQAFGVVDPSFFWGRTIGAADGLPGHAPYRVRSGGEGVLQVETSEGEFSYHPDQGAPPEIRGEPWVFEGGASGIGPVRVRPDATGTGGATVRYRLDGHHVSRALGEEMLLGDEPGHHRIELVAFDRDLRASAPVRVDSTVPYPAYYSKRFVLAAVSIFVLAAFAFFVWRSRSPWRAAVSSVLACAIALQVLAGIVPHAKGWPFVGFGMYSSSTPSRGVVTEEALVGLYANGRWRKLDAPQLGVAIDTIHQVIQPLVSGGDEAAREYVRAWNELHPSPGLRGLQVQVRRTRLLPDGPVRIAPLVLVDWRKEESGGG
jgi:hypothetical protein